jgi:hypothetical protein
MKASELRASELRVGNITTLGVVSLIDQDVFRVVDSEGDSFKNTWAEIKPIPLTEEWLLKLGFKQCGYEMLSWKHETLLPSFDLDGINWADFDEPDYQFLNYKVADEILRIDYVHQLQNLYFVLTGEELKQQEQ